MTVPWEAMDAEHPDHDEWVAQAGRCFAGHRHPTAYIVLRYAQDFPPEKRSRLIDGRWMDAPDPLRIDRPARTGDPFFRTVSVAEPTGRFETRDDGELARVWELRLVSDTPCCDYRDHSPEPCACPDHPESYLHPLGTKPWPEP